MAQQVIGIGTVANDGTGDPLRTAWTKANGNFTELYGRGTINSGTLGTLAFYAASGTALSPLTLGANLSITGTTLNAAGGGGLSSIANNNLLANTSGSAAVPVATTVSALLDSALGSAQGDVLYRSGSGWAVLTPGSAGQFLQSGGASANVTWASATGAGTVNSGTTNTLAFYAGSGTAVSPLTLGTNLSITGTTLNAAGGASRTIAAGLTAAGTTQGTALALTADDSIVTTAASGTGVILRTANGQVVVNRGANALLVYPPASGTIEGGAANAAVSVPSGGSATFNTADGATFYAR